MTDDFSRTRGQFFSHQIGIDFYVNAHAKGKKKKKRTAAGKQGANSHLPRTDDSARWKIFPTLLVHAMASSTTSFFIFLFFSTPLAAACTFLALFVWVRHVCTQFFRSLSFAFVFEWLLLLLFSSVYSRGFHPELLLLLSRDS